MADDDSIILSRYEVSRIIGLRAMQLDEGAMPFVTVLEKDSSLSIATREGVERKLYFLVKRGALHYHVKDARFPKDLDVLMRTLEESL